MLYKLKCQRVEYFSVDTRHVLKDEIPPNLLFFGVRNSA